MATNAAGAAVWYENYSAFGERLNNEAAANASSVANVSSAAGVAPNPNANQNWFIGKPVDNVTGLVYFGARWRI
jgi:hypothetical protein